MLCRITNFPEIDRSVPEKAIEEGERFSSRYCRNRRLGEFLVELELTEEKSAGVPAIQEELRKNGSPMAVFLTDEDRGAVTVEIPVHPDLLPAADRPQQCNDTINDTIKCQCHIKLKPK